MALTLLILASLGIYAAGIQQWRKHYKLTQIENQSTKSTLKRSWNWFSNMVWPAYLLIFATGLWLNNWILP